jgi:sugar lactone lactonase YvrE
LSEVADVRVVPRDRPRPARRGADLACDEGALYWVDILEQRLNRLTLADGRVDEWAMPEMIGWVIPRHDAPGFVAGLQSGVKALSLEPFALAPFADCRRSRRATG